MIVTRDAFLEGFPHEFQVQLRLSESTASKSVKELSEDVHRLQMAGIGERRSSEVMSASSCGSRQVFNSSHLSIGVETPMCQEVDDDRSTDADRSGLVNVVEASGSRQKPIWSRGRGRGQRGARQKTSGRVCFICGDPDHIRPNCPDLHDCHRCLRPGHIARNCTALVPIQRDNGKQGRIANLTTNGSIMVTARVGKGQCPFLVDTGADVSLLSYDVVEANRLVMQRQVVRQPLMVDGTVLRCEGLVNEFIQLGSRGIRASFMWSEESLTVYWELMFSLLWPYRLMWRIKGCSLIEKKY